MIEGEDDQRYRVHLLRLTWGVLPGRLWGRWIRVREPTYFEGDAVRNVVGKRAWAGDLWDASRNPQFEIYGQRPGEELWRPLSRRLLEQERLARQIAAAMLEAQAGLNSPHVEDASQAPDPVDDMVEVLRDVIERHTPPPGSGEALVHMLDHDPHMRRDHALLVLRRFDDWRAVEGTDFKHLLRDGRKRLAKGELCRFCSPSTPP